jgi:hypothetical protein
VVPMFGAANVLNGAARRRFPAWPASTSVSCTLPRTHAAVTGPTMKGTSGRMPMKFWSDNAVDPEL